MTKITRLPAHNLTELLREARRNSLPLCVYPVTVPPSHRGKNKKLESQCACIAKLNIDDKNLCLRHAQVVALEILMKEPRK